MTKKLVLLSFIAIALMASGCSKEYPVAPELTGIDAGKNLQKPAVAENPAILQPSNGCAKVTIEGLVPIGVHTISFEGLEELWNALVHAGAFGEHPPFSQVAYVDPATKTITGFGAVPGDYFDIAGVSGTLVSIETYEHKPSNGQQSPTRARLIHLFKGEEGSFVTMDQAILVPTVNDPTLLKVNDDLEIIAGTGVFENASGKLKNRGIINLNTYNLTVNLIGRICADGI